MFTESVRVSCDFSACCGGSAKCQTGLIFHQPSITLDLDPCFTYMETILSCLFTSCHSHFQTYPILLPPSQETLAGLSYSSTPTSQALEQSRLCLKAN